MSDKKLKVINLFGGPGSGKSTTRAGLFNLMKLESMEVEEVTEFAKDLTWEKRFHTLSDSVYVVSKQNHRTQRLEGQVDWVITDSPLWVATAYNSYIDQDLYEKLVNELYGKYNNFNFFIKRAKDYNPNGRNQTEDEARAIDSKIRDTLKRHNVHFVDIDGNTDAPRVILDYCKTNT